ncbi:hypothetical protein V5N11_020463 [Cardamine amara subsp. amara]|uniref:Myb/SANT-like domain-containing protein n=1 Tax=Cardamine amara subsp. amara TaxID=228776 RepID=A0ABD1AUM2_CARAN
MSERNMRSKNGHTATRGRSKGKGKSTDEPERSKGKDKSTDEPKYVWSPRYTEIFLELVNNELKGKNYAVRVPDNPGKKRIEENFYERTGEKLTWKPEMKNRIDYMRTLWHINSILINRTGISVINEKINMPELWWNDRIAEFGKNGRFVRVLQSKPLPFKEILDEIYSKHDVEQYDRYSPHTLRVHLQQSQNEGGSDDDVEVDDGSEDNGSEIPLELSSDDEFPSDGPSPTPTTKEQAQSCPFRINRSNLGVRKTTIRRPNRKRNNFETQVQTRFQPLEESRTGLLDVLWSRHNPKASFGDALAELELLAVKQMGKFWWEANRLLMNDEDVRDGFMKLRSEEYKIQFLERLVGIDRYGLPCDIINLRGPASIITPVPATHSQMAGISNIASSSYCPGYRMFEMSSSGTSFSTLLGLSPQTQ